MHSDTLADYSFTSFNTYVCGKNDFETSYKYNRNFIDLKREIENIVEKLLTGTITDLEKKILAEWIDRDESNRNELARVINIHQLTHPEFYPEEINLDAAEKNVASKIIKPKKVYSFFEIWKHAAAILLIPLMIGTLYLAFRQSTDNKLAQSTMQEISVPPGTRTFITLPDSTKVWLNADSKIKFPLVFNKKERRVFLNGEAYFMVKSDVKHPFIVNTGGMNVIATGTAFNVEAYTSDSVTAVTLMEGKVSINYPSSNVETTIQLKPDQRFVLNSQSQQYKIMDTQSQDWQQWKDGVLVFRDETLENVFKRVGRTFNVNIVIKDESLARQTYRATFEKESLEKILLLIEKTAPIRYLREDNNDGDRTYEVEKIEVYQR